MHQSIPVTALFVDIGGVMLTNGWGRASRKLAADKFNLDVIDFEERHQLAFVTYEEGKLTMEDYLRRVIFYKTRSFSPDQFRDFIFDQSAPYTEMIELIKKLKAMYRLKIAVVSNEARELNDYRIDKFQLNSFVDFFISSCFVHLRKPDPEIFRLALDIAKVPAGQVLYIDDVEMFVDVARDLGIRSIHHHEYATTIEALASAGLILH